MVRKALSRWVAAFMVAVFAFVSVSSDVFASVGSLNGAKSLPVPTAMIALSQAYSYPVLKGLTIDPENPLNLEFIIDTADQGRVDEAEARRLVNFFLAAVAVPQKDLWVNLSPTEKDRVVTDELGATVLGEELLAQDYLLKQLSSSLTDPNTELGKGYWSSVSNFRSDISNANKIWIMPDKAKVYAKGNKVFVTEATLKVQSEFADKQMLLPAITKEVNEGEHFAPIRQAYSSIILGLWFKEKLKNSIYKEYIDRKQVNGIATSAPQSKEEIFNAYVESFKKGVYNTTAKTRENGRLVKKAYFSGGFKAGSAVVQQDRKAPRTHGFFKGALAAFALMIIPAKQALAAKVVDLTEGPVAVEQTKDPAVAKMLRAADSLRALKQTVFAKAELSPEQKETVTKAAKGMLSLIDDETGLPVSHVGTKQMEDWAFTYDVACAAEGLRVAGNVKEGKRMLDYFDSRYRVSPETMKSQADANGFFGPMFSMVSPYTGKTVRSFATAVSTKVNSGKGAAREWRVQPGPTAFLMFAMMNADAKGYEQTLRGLADFLIGIQASDGGFRRGFTDGAFAANNVDTEPHLDAMTALLRMFVVFGDQKYRDAAEKAFQWALKNTIDRDAGYIYQGTTNGQKGFIDATDVKTWGSTMVGDYLSLAVSDSILSAVERNNLVAIQFTRADGQEVKAFSFDFTNPSDKAVISMRGGYHPMGTVEWMLGGVNAYYAQAVRHFRAGNLDAATKLKAKGDALKFMALNIGIEKDGELRFPYATAQNVAVGHGWNTPTWNSKAGRGKDGYRSGIGNAWMVFSYGWNIFGVDGGSLGRDLAKIPSLPMKDAIGLMKAGLVNTPYLQEGAQNFTKDAGKEWISEKVIQETWGYYNKGDLKKSIEIAEEAMTRWSALAQKEQTEKQAKVGGIVGTDWSTVEADGPQFNAAYKYPLLNECAAFKWVLVASNYRLGNIAEAKKHMLDIIKNYSLGQIYDPMQKGFWYPLRSFDKAEGGQPIDKSLQKLFGEVLAENGLSRAAVMPKEIPWRQVASGKVVSSAKPVMAGKQSENMPAAKQADAAPDANNLVSQGRHGEYSDGQWKAQAQWLDFETPIAAKAGDKVAFSVTLTGGKVIGVQFVGTDESEGNRGDMQIVRGSGTFSFEVPVSETKKIRRIAFQIGENAWGPLGGSMNARITVNSIKIKKANSAISVQKIREGLRDGTLKASDLPEVFTNREVRDAHVGEDPLAMRALKYAFDKRAEIRAAGADVQSALFDALLSFSLVHMQKFAGEEEHDYDDIRDNTVIARQLEALKLIGVIYAKTQDFGLSVRIEAALLSTSNLDDYPQDRRVAVVRGELYRKFAGVSSALTDEEIMFAIDPSAKRNEADLQRAAGLRAELNPLLPLLLSEKVYAADELMVMRFLRYIDAYADEVLATPGLNTQALLDAVNAVELGLPEESALHRIPLALAGKLTHKIETNGGVDMKEMTVETAQGSSSIELNTTNIDPTIFSDGIGFRTVSLQTVTAETALAGLE